MAKLDTLKQEATDLGIEYKSKVTIAELEALIAEKKEGAKNEVTQTLGENEQNDERLAELKAKATELKIDFEDDVKAEELEEFINDVEAMRAKAKAKAEEPKLNKDGFEAGKQLTPDEFAKYMAKQKAKK